MVVIAIALLIVVSVAIVAYPYFSNTREKGLALASGTNRLLEDLIVQRDSAYTAIKDLESEYAMDKLSESDYRTMRQKYEVKAALILEQLDAIKPAKSQPRRASGE